MPCEPRHTRLLQFVLDAKHSFHDLAQSSAALPSVIDEADRPISYHLMSLFVRIRIWYCGLILATSSDRQELNMVFFIPVLFEVSLGNILNNENYLDT